MPFQLLELLGEGSQGRVYKALRFDRRSGLQQVVAIKILHSKTAVDLWRQEFHSLSRVRSPFCVQVLSFERIFRRPALVLEFVEGVSLARLGPACCLSADDIAEIVAQTEMGLKDLHQQSVLHGDLSPQNILVDLRGRVRLVDFGLANCAELRVTPQFAAPERLRGVAASEAADLFALGRVERFLTGDRVHRACYSHSDPLLRTFQDLGPCSLRQKDLAAKVERFYALQQQSPCLTTRTEPPLGRKWMLRPEFVASLSAVFILLTPNASHSSHSQPPGFLHVRTRKWLYLSVNGHAVGYSPVNLTAEPGELLRLQWTSASGRGVKEVLLQSAQSVTLEDSDFSH